MKKNILILFLTIIQFTYCQEKIISRNWTSFTQFLNITSDTEKKFKIVGSIKVNPKDKKASAGLWARVDTHDGEPGFFDNMANKKIRLNKWKEYTLEGTINKNSKSINFGGLCLFNGEFYFDDIKLFIEDKEGNFKQIAILNGSFEKKIVNNRIENWYESIESESSVRIKEYSLSSSKDATSGSKSLLIIGSNIDVPEYDYGKIGNESAKNPQIDNMISMLEDLKSRLERRVKNLPLEHIDHLHDSKSNRFGALVMHLAAAEVYYQKYTFGESVFEKENPEMWSIGLDLGDKAREMFKNKPISYYLDIFSKVRKKTIEELRKRNDKWFKEVNAGNSISNQYSWFHVMEHQSSHLGQILFLAKRLPPLKKEVKLKEMIKN